VRSLSKIKTIKELQVEFFSVVMPFSVAVGYQCFKGPCCLYLWRQHGPLKCWYPTTTVHGITTHKNLTWIFTAMKTSYLITKTVSMTTTHQQSQLLKLCIYQIQHEQWETVPPNSIWISPSQYNDEVLLNLHFTFFLQAIWT